MKNRIKKFYKNNENTIKFITSRGIPIAAGALSIYLIVDGRSIKSADIFDRDDGLKIMAIRHKNGNDTVLTLITENK